MYPPMVWELMPPRRIKLRSVAGISTGNAINNLNSHRTLVNLTSAAFVLGQVSGRSTASQKKQSRKNCKCSNTCNHTQWPKAEKFSVL